MTNYLKKAILGVIWIFLLSLCGLFFLYLFRLVLARNLTPEEYGLFYSVLSLVITLHLFKDPGLKYALIKYVSEFFPHKKFQQINRIFSLTILTWTGTSFIFSAILILLAPWLTQTYFKQESAYFLIIFFSIAYFWTGDYIIAYIFQGIQKMALFAAVDASRSFLYLIITFSTFHFYSHSLIFPAIAYAVTPIILTIIYLPFLKKQLPQLKLTLKVPFQFVKKMTTFGIPLSITNISYTFLQQISILILTYFGSLKDVGLLNVALPTAALLVTLSSSLLYVVFPMSSELTSRGHINQLKKGLFLLYKYSFMILLPASLLLFAFSDLAILTLFGEKYIEATTALMILTFGSLFWVLANINFTVLAGIGKSREPLNAMIFMMIITVILNFVFVPFFALTGAVIAILTGYILAFILSLFMLKRHIPLTIPYWLWIKNLFAGILFLFAVVIAKKTFVLTSFHFEAAVILFVTGIIYILLIFLFRIVTIKELKSILTRFLIKK
ncbi:hypothetical protein COV18_02105 [Candidatus Woesearchaeota archaeon CG10_big_fil_rev_8_21_14_0_10_37_12]|nr:MAG: hypothetical protein COV18_02105 [Candidatus Woesearchaeota archaeon CG10_big_fil_rev_8_21_14_0_10_37_12]